MHNFPFDIVGFDLDGTLIDSKRPWHRSQSRIGTGRVSGRSPDRIPALWAGHAVLMERALAVQDVTLDDVGLTALAAELVRYYEDNIAVHSRLFPGGADMLDDLDARGVKIAVVTNKMEHLARKLFGELGLTDRFYTIIGGDTLGPGRQSLCPTFCI
jgi:phosphoglycolate phosphatase